jgi:hypothetical protein
MYTQHTCIYSTDEEYQSTLLKIFQVRSHDELGNHIEKLYQSLHHPTLSTILNKVMEVYVWANPEHAFYVLFSYDYLMYTYPYLVNLLEETEYTESYEKLLAELK